MDWWSHRIASSQRYSVGLVEICERWSTRDVMDAHAVLDAYDAAELELARRPPRR